MNKLPWYGWIAVLGLVALVVNLYAYAGLGQEPQVGQAVAAQARTGSLLTHTYLVAGRHLLSYTPFMRPVARALASSTWSDAFAAIRKQPSVALFLLQNRSGGAMYRLMQLLYWLPLILFFAATIGWILRPRKVSLIPNRN